MSYINFDAKTDDKKTVFDLETDLVAKLNDFNAKYIDYLRCNSNLNLENGYVTANKYYNEDFVSSFTLSNKLQSAKDLSGWTVPTDLGSMTTFYKGNGNGGNVMAGSFVNGISSNYIGVSQYQSSSISDIEITSPPFTVPDTTSKYRLTFYAIKNKNSADTTQQLKITIGDKPAVPVTSIISANWKKIILNDIAFSSTTNNTVKFKWTKPTGTDKECIIFITSIAVVKSNCKNTDMATLTSSSNNLNESIIKLQTFINANKSSTESTPNNLASLTELSNRVKKIRGELDTKLKEIKNADDSLQNMYKAQKDAVDYTSILWTVAATSLLYYVFIKLE